MALKQRAAPPIPYDVLAQLQDALSVQHGSTLWEGDGRPLLVARVPGEELDLVADLEAIVDVAEPAHIANAKACLIIASRGLHQVPIEPLHKMMDDRRRLDAAQAQEIRAAVPAGAKLYRSAADPKRRLRLGVRLTSAKVADVEDAELEGLVEKLGPRLARGYDDLYCVHLVADDDAVRLPTAVFAEDLLSKFHDEDRRRRLEAEARQKADAARRLREDERAAVLHHLESRYPDPSPSVVRKAPERSASPMPASDAGRIEREVPDEAVAPGHDALRGRVDAIPAPRSRAMTEPEVAWTAPEPAAAPVPLTTGDKDMDALAGRLAAGGYEVIVDPPVDGVVLAAERASDYPQRIIACASERLRADAAKGLLATARDLDVDLAIVVAEAIDPEAQRVIVATKVKRIRPSDIADLRL